MVVALSLQLLRISLLINSLQSILLPLETVSHVMRHVTISCLGMIFHQLSPFNVAKCVIAQVTMAISHAHYYVPSSFQPSILEYCLLHLLSVIGQLNISVLTQLASVLDPSHSTIQPLLQHAHSNLKR